MDLEQKLVEDMKTAMKARDKVRLETIRLIRSQLKNTQIERRHELSEQEILQVLMSAAKKRKEAVEQFKLVGREDRADMELQELKIIESYLPEQLSGEEIARMVEETLQQVNASSIKDMGKVMGALMPRVKGKADGKVVQEIVREKLAAL